MRWMICFLCLSSTAFAQLQWEQRRVEVKAHYQDTNTVAHFPFVNISTNQIIRIMSSRTSCGCTTANLDKRVYPPGEKGNLMVNFVFGDRIGEQQKEIILETNDPKESTVLLTLKVTIPEPIKITPVHVFWKMGEEASSKTIAIQIQQDTPIHVTKVTASSEKLKVQLQAIEDGRRYTLQITPTDTHTSAFVPIRIETDFPTNAPRVITVYGQIK